jgi:hypothetical protein
MSELEEEARELAFQCDECDAGRVSEEDFQRVIDRIFAGKTDREKARLLIRTRQLQGGHVFAIAQDGEIIGASSDEAEAMGRRLVGKQHS